jgi:hypothetical protein
MECRFAGETEVLEGNLPQSNFCPSQNPTWPDPGLNPGRRGGKPATNPLSYGAANVVLVFNILETASWSLGHEDVRESPKHWIPSPHFMADGPRRLNWAEWHLNLPFPFIIFTFNKNLFKNSSL